MTLTAPEANWNLFINQAHPFDVFEAQYKTLFPNWQQLPQPVWFPDEKTQQNTHIYKLMQEKNISTYGDFHHYSVTQYPNFWQTIVAKLNIQFEEPPAACIDLKTGIETPTWFPKAKLNIINSCFQAKPQAVAVISQAENGEIIQTSYQQLDRLSNQVANGLLDIVNPGDYIAIIMPMTLQAVAIYLGIIKAGCIAVAIPDSFSAEEIKVRLQITQTKVVFCQDEIIRDGKHLPLYTRIAANNLTAIVVLAADNTLSIPLTSPALNWQDFLSTNATFTCHIAKPTDFINILFSSGTTGQPKAIPWDHTTPIKCASDAYLHHNVHPGDVFCWPTNLGWMMGPWLIFATLINKATIALFEGSPMGKTFGEFVAASKTTHLGVVPTMVKTWRDTACMEDLNWQSIKLFTSTGERSNLEDMLYLTWLCPNRPILEYCGGTEIAGAYLTGTLMQPQAPAAFSTPALGLHFLILDEEGHPANNGEVALIPPSIGLSQRLLNKNHHEIYYANMPRNDTHLLRRHGDQVELFPNGYYRLLGRIDDTMKLGGIKISSAEIEMVISSIPTLIETAAIATTPAKGGPSQLVIYAVPKAHQQLDPESLKKQMQRLIKEILNPLFKIHEVLLIDTLPRTASNKIMRRVLREQYQQRQKI